VDPDREKNSPLLYQIMTDGTDLEVIRLLLQYGADTNGRFFEYGCRRDTIETIVQKCLGICYQKNRTDLIELLLKYGANANQELRDLQDGRNHTRETNWYIIHELISRPAILKVFLDNGAKVNTYKTDLYQREETAFTAETALHKTVANGIYDSTLILLLHGADPNAHGASKNSKYTPLHSSIISKHPDLTSLLITFNADLSLPYFKDSKSPQTVTQLLGEDSQDLLHRKPLVITKKIYSFLPRKTKENVMMWLLVVQRLGINNWPKDINQYIIEYLIMPEKVAPIKPPKTRTGWGWG